MIRARKEEKIACAEKPSPPHPFFLINEKEKRMSIPIHRVRLGPHSHGRRVNGWMDRTCRYYCGFKVTFGAGLAD